MKKVCMLGEGAWGTAVSTLLANNGYAVNLWCHDPEVAQEIQTERCNERYLPNVTLAESIKPTTSHKEALANVQWVFQAIPVKYLREVLQSAKPYVTPEQVWVVLSKGIEKDSLLLPTQMIDDVFDVEVKKAVFAGPSFAHEVATKRITAVAIAAIDCAIGLELQTLLANEYFRPYITTDIIGVQVGAALKNVITLGIGLLDGAGYADNTKALLITRGLHEMVQLIRSFGGRQETAYGLSGVGDLVLTSMGKLSRNLEVGKQLGAGKSLDTILHETGYIPEGINTVESVHQLAKRQQLELPICQGIYDVIFSDLSIDQMLKQFMAQPLEWECKVEED